MNSLLAPAPAASAGWTVCLALGVRLEMWHDRHRLTARLDLPFLAGCRRFRPARIAWGLAGVEPLPEPVVADLPGGGSVSIGMEGSHPVLRIARGASTIGVRLKGDELIKLSQFADQVDAYRLCRSDAPPVPVCSGPLIEVAP